MSALRWSIVVAAWSLGLIVTVALAAAAYPALSRLANGPSGGILQVGSSLGATSGEHLQRFDAAPGDAGTLHLRSWTERTVSPAGVAALVARHKLAFAVGGLIVFLPFSAWFLRVLRGNPATWGRRQR